MMRCHQSLLGIAALFVSCCGLTLPVQSQDWPSFRGANASGQLGNANLPLRWNAETGLNVRWRLPIAGHGHSSPVVAGNRVFLTTAVAQTAGFEVPRELTGDMFSSTDTGAQSWVVLCIDADAGAIVWQKVVHTGTPRSKRHPLNSYATPTPAISGNRVVVSFGSEGLYCFSLDGELIWKRDLGPLSLGNFEHREFQWGYASSPVIHRGLVIVQCDADRNAFVAAFRLKDGEQVWRTKREDLPAWSTPTVVEWQGRSQIVTLAPSYVRAYDLQSGEELWRLYWGMDQVECTPIASDGVIYFSGGHGRTGPIYAVRANARGDITLNGGQESNEFVIWSKLRGGGLTTTPILLDGYLYVLTNQGILRCFEARTGKLMYEKRVGPGAFLAAPVASAARIYLTGQDGDIHVIRAGPKYELLATNPMGDVCQATPALLKEKMLIRTRGALLAVEEGARQPKISFREVTRQAGLGFRSLPPLLDPKMRHVNALWANFIAGVAVGDFDGDGFDDIFAVASRAGETGKLYRNRGDLTFEDVTEKTGLPSLNDDRNICTGALWFDYDNDGRPDLLIVRFGVNKLFRNLGNGRFEDVSAQSGLGRKRQNALSAIAFDYNNDGKLDLLVGGFFADDVDLLHLRDTRVLPNHGQQAKNGGTKTLYRNNGDGTFTDVTAEAGIHDTGFTAALGHADYDNDGWQDVYIANDFGQDRLYKNTGMGSFREVTWDSTGRDGRKGMNVDFGDFNNDGFLDIYVTNITEPWLPECNMLWQNGGDGTFIDVSRETGTCDTGWGWGAKFFDADNDGLLDLYVANGFISAGPKDYIEVVQKWQSDPAASAPENLSDAAQWPPIGDRSFAGHERKKLFHNRGSGIFDDVAESAGLATTLDGRGVALADFDHDGRVDLLLTNADGDLQLYRNEGSARNWIELSLTGVKSNRNAIGARIRVTAGKRLQIREVNGGNGYASQSSLQAHVGLGKAEIIDTIEILWPSGVRQTLRNVKPNQILLVTEPAVGQGG